MKYLIGVIIAIFTISQISSKQVRSNAAATWTCDDKCTQFIKDAPCQCNQACERYNNCCDDYSLACVRKINFGEISDEELTTLSEHLFHLDEFTQIAQNIEINVQNKTNFRSQDDVALYPLFQVDLNGVKNPALEHLRTLYDIYIADINIPEESSFENEAKITSFLNLMLETPIVKTMQGFLSSKNISSDEQTFRNLWFVPYPRGKHGKGSSGFEHVFLGELKNGVSGFHNWIYFAHEENAARLNYKGYLDVIPLNGNRFVIATKFDWLGSNKREGTMFIGTSPQFDLSIFTLCAIARPNKLCRVSLNGHKITIKTFVTGSQVMSAYPYLTWV